MDVPEYAKDYPAVCIEAHIHAKAGVTKARIEELLRWALTLEDTHNHLYPDIVVTDLTVITVDRESHE